MSSKVSKEIAILGTRGIPAQHGGFETFAEHLALYLTDRGWKITVYCQLDGKQEPFETRWKHIRLIHIPGSFPGPVGTIVFDWRSTLHAAAQESKLILVLGYNTAIFNVLYRLKGKTILFNMDGLDWKRQKWNAIERCWLLLNEAIGCRIGNHLIADHPEILNRLVQKVSKHKVTMIPYGANEINTGDKALLLSMGLQPNQYCLVIARPEPENQILEITRSFSAKKRSLKLVILGNIKANTNKYQSAILDTAGTEVVFLGAVYQENHVSTLRHYARLYIHGHTVGGTNPSLLEAMGAGAPVLAHNNKFNRWVCGSSAHFFDCQQTLSDELDTLLINEDELQLMRKSSFKRFQENFSWERTLKKYETLLLKHTR